MKKSVLLLIVCFLFSRHLIAQCDLFVTATVELQTCAGDDFVFYGFANADCPDYTTIQYTWQPFVNGNPESPPELIQSGTAPSLTSIPSYTYVVEGNPILIGVTLEVTLLDAENQPLATIGTVAGDNEIEYLQPLYVATSMSNNNCGASSCVTVTAVGGVTPYTYMYSDGSNGQSVACFDAPGVYVVTVMDAVGCVASESFIVQEAVSQNNTCDIATPLEDEVMLTDTICDFNQNTAECSNGISFYQTGWYVINSGVYSHINFGVSNNYYYNQSPNMMLTVEVYEEVSGQPCEDAELVACVSNEPCFDVATYVGIQPNTNYYFRVLMAWTTLLPVSVYVNLSDDTDGTICGCTNNQSCNYDPGSIINDGSCGYNGCMDAGACNYVSWATCDDGSCIYGTDITGLVFHDVNGDGIRNTWPITEPVIGNLGYVFIEELNIELYADASGSFVLPELAAGVYHIQYVDPNGSWILSVDSPIEITLPTCNGLLVPLVPSSNAAIQLSGSGWAWNSVIQCTMGTTSGLWLQNTGSVPVSGTISITIDELFTVSTPSWAIPYDSFENGIVTWEFENQLPGSYAYYQVFVSGPGVEYVGQSFDFFVDITVEDNLGAEFYSNSWTYSSVVTCAYDPNDKQAIPEGFADPNFILAEDEIEYKIRFQNTGNAPAFDVRIEDQIDLTTLDLSTFEPVVASHSFSTIIQDDGLVKFVFNNIMLPDSGSDLEGSQGYVIYRIKPLPDIQPETEIYNTAEIFFDDNPAVVTNTTLHTIYSCDLLADLPTVDDICFGEYVSLDATDAYVTSYEWQFDGEFVSSSPTLFLQPGITGTHTITLIRSNPLCMREDQTSIVIMELPGDNITANGNELTAPAGAAWTWYLDGDLLQGVTTQTITATVAGGYTVVTTSINGCQSVSLPAMVTNVEATIQHSLSLFPNPATEQVQLNLPQGIWTIELYNGVGELISKWYNKQGNMLIELSELAAGTYQFRVNDDNNNTHRVSLVVK